MDLIVSLAIIRSAIEHLTFVSLLAKQFENRSPKTSSSRLEDRGTDIKRQFPPTISLAFPKIH